MDKIWPARPAALARLESLPAKAEMEVVVVYTGVKPTLGALEAAAALVQGLTARIRLVVPQPVPFPAQLDRPPVQREFVERKFRTLAEKSAVDTYVEIRVCREWETGALQGLKPGSVVVIGDRMRWWPVRRERRLARTLRKNGHQVLLVGSGKETPHA